jgi:hypothetical protein
LDLTVNQALAILDDGMSLAAIEDATLAIVDTATAIQGLTTDQIADLGDAGFATIMPS